MGEETGFVVTIREIYEETKDLTSEMRDLTNEVRSLTAELRESRKTDEDHEGRLRVLERWMWGLPVSILTAIGAVITAIVT